MGSRNTGSTRVPYAVLLLTAFLCTGHAQFFDCPEEDDYYPDSDDCRLYYRCVSRKFTVYHCAEGLFYNPDTITCSWPDQVPSCDPETAKRTTVWSPYRAKRQAEYDYGGDYTEPERAGTDGDEGRDQSEANPDNVYPETGGDQSVSNNDPTSAEFGQATSVTDFICPEEYGYFTDPNDCSVYFRCVGGGVTRYKCAPGLVFDQDHTVCSWPGSVKCASKSRRRRQAEDDSSKPGAVGSQGSSAFHCPPTGKSYHMHPHNCNHYYECVNGKRTPFQCGPGLYFSANVSTCVWPHQAWDCVHRQRRDVPPMKVASQIENKNFTCPRPEGYYAHHDNCSIFYRCVNGAAFVYSCSPGTLFSAETADCRSPVNVWGCDKNGRRHKRQADLDSLYQGESVDFECPAEDGYYGHPENCSIFFRCVNGRASSYECPEGSLYSEDLTVCTWPGNAWGCDNSGRREKPRSDQSPSTYQDKYFGAE